MTCLKLLWGIITLHKCNYISDSVSGKSTRNHARNSTMQMHQPKELNVRIYRDESQQTTCNTPRPNIIYPLWMSCVGVEKGLLAPFNQDDNWDYPLLRGRCSIIKTCHEMKREIQLIFYALSYNLPSLEIPKFSRVFSTLNSIYFTQDRTLLIMKNSITTLIA